MGVVKYSEGIEYVKGALSKPKKRNGHECGNYLIGTHREAATTNPHCTRLYIKGADGYKRSTPVTQNEMGARQRFSQVAAMVKTRSTDLQRMSIDQANFAAQKDQPGGAKTLKKYYWRICGQEYDAQQG